MRLFWPASVVGLSACSLVADFSGLDDAPRGAPGGGGAQGGAGVGAEGAAAATAGGGGAALAGGAGGQGGGRAGGAHSGGGAGGSGGAPACKEAVTPCTDHAECCRGLICAETVTEGVVCCGLLNAPCSWPNGEDCCGSSECVAGKCD